MLEILNLALSPFSLCPSAVFTEPAPWLGLAEEDVPAIEFNYHDYAIFTIVTQLLTEVSTSWVCAHATVNLTVSPGAFVINM